MEKLTAGLSKFTRRLLILLLISINVPVFSQNASPNPQSLQSLHVVPLNQFCFTASECQFNLEIPDYMPSEIQFVYAPFPEESKFISSKKTSSASGTLITMWFQFNKAGVYSLKPMTVIIDGNHYKANFEPVTVYENLDNLKPELSVDFINSSFNQKNGEIICSAGEHIGFTLNIRYAIQIIDFTYELPKNSIFTELKRFPVTEGKPRGSQFNPNFEPVAAFDWQPFTPGEYKMPPVKISATAYNGLCYDITLPEYKIVVTEKKASVQSGKKSGDLQELQKITLENSKETDEEQNESTEIDLQHLIELRMLEKKSFPFSKNARARKEYEMKMQLPFQIREESLLLLNTFVILFALFLILTVLFFILRKKSFAIVFLVFTVAIMFPSVFTFVRLNQKHAVFVKGTVNSIPEESAESCVVLHEGTCVQIKKITDDWVYVRYDESAGWIKKENLIFLE